MYYCWMETLFGRMKNKEKHRISFILFVINVL